jgi:hypothetical protein
VARGQFCRPLNNLFSLDFDARHLTELGFPLTPVRLSAYIIEIGIDRFHDLFCQNVIHNHPLREELNMWNSVKNELTASSLDVLVSIPVPAGVGYVMHDPHSVQYGLFGGLMYAGITASAGVVKYALSRRHTQRHPTP